VNEDNDCNPLYILKDFHTAGVLLMPNAKDTTPRLRDVSDEDQRIEHSDDDRPIGLLICIG